MNQHNSFNRVAVLGLGHTGLPMAIEYAQTGHEVTAYDTNRNLTEQLTEGRSHIRDVPNESLTHEDLYFTSDANELTNSDVYVICVPTPLNAMQQADMTHVEDAFALVNESADNGAVVILQSTVPVGATRALAQTINTDVLDVTVAYSPERVDPGVVHWDIESTPRLIAAVNPADSDLAAAVLSVACPRVVVVDSPEVAEMAKLWENTYRAVNIAATYELQRVCDENKINARDVINAAGTKPYGFHKFYPGPGVGGDCIPTDPYFLLQAAWTYETTLIETAMSAIRDRPARVVATALKLLQTPNNYRECRVLVLGATYKPEVADTRNSPGKHIIESLLDQFIHVDYCDPVMGEIHVNGAGMRRVDWVAVTGNEYDLIIVATADPYWTEREASVWNGTAKILDPWGLIRTEGGKEIHGVN